MKIMIINGSPKYGESTSKVLIEYLVSKMEKYVPQIYCINQKPLSETELEQVLNSDALVFAFPLYIDSIPSHLLKELVYMEKLDFKKNTRVYCMVNNGFYEGEQNRVAIEQMKLWCAKAGLIWGGGLGTGSGEMIPQIKYVPLGQGPNKNLGISITRLAKCIESKESCDDMLIRLNWPRWLWRIQAGTTLWYPLAKKNHVKKHEMYQKRIIES